MAATETPAPTTDETANWKTYTANGYSFAYPADWTVTKSDYINTVQVMNPSKTVSLLISDSGYPFDLSPDTKMTSTDIEVTVAGKMYTEKENIVNNSSVYTDFKLDTTADHHVMFGSGTPVPFTQASLSDYTQLKPTLLKILSTIKISS